MHIREATRDNIKVITDFQKQMAIETENLFLNSELVKKGVTAVFKNRYRGTYYVVEIDEEIIACLLTTYEWSDWRNSYVIWIQSVYVLPNHRGKGVFKFMYNHIKELVKSKKKYSGIRLYVDKLNVNAQNVYKKIGMNGKHYRLFEDME